MPGEKPQAGQPKLLKVFDSAGKAVREFGDLIALGDPMTSGYGSNIAYDLNAQDEIVASCQYQNRIEKYSRDGQLLWRAERPLNYALEIKRKGSMDSSGGVGGQVRMQIQMPEMTECSRGVAVDAQGRAWVVTYNRQLRKEEQVRTSMMMSMGGSGGQTVSSKVEGDTDLRTTDALKLEVFDANGILLGEIGLSHFADVVRFQGNFLFIIDRDRGAAVYQYKIVEK
jgi:hypothetical protein